ncbi:Gfo/Idh/MocA family protein [Devosia sp. Root635]|uniref:Gfo/Idh/MocA family protein n=1 Tax=Devosia sp. Root635 TaxID=1736575 RepID=UPI0006F90F23|nr:Gfo/Idh/MocA family oxidoreductase [Devosia sp. Root635]KRA55913.1 oxidoreductase [Devosia sp. Root635]
MTTHQKAVLAGAGAMSRKWLDAIRTIGGVDIVGIVDIYPANAEKRAEEQGIAPEIGTDLKAMLARLTPDIVLDVAIPAARHEIVSTALAAGAHVLSEKPMAETMEQARDLVARARAADRLHVVVQNRRYLAQLRRIRRLVASGAIGELTAIHCDFFLDPHFGGFREQMAHVLLLDMAIHTFDAARFVADDAASSVYAEEWNPAGSWYREGSSALASFRFAGGAVFTYRGSWCAPGLRTSWESAWRIVGTAGSVVWDGADDIRAERSVPGAGQLLPAVEPVAIPVLDPADRIGGHLGVITDFIAATRGGPVPETVGHENIKSLAMVLGAIDSVGQGGRVEIVI